MAKKILAVFLSIVLSAQLFVIGVSAKGKKYIIVNPYEKVDWDEWGSYKFQPHCHTNASDGYLTVKESVQMHYDLNYDIVALTDHGTVNKGWNQKPDLVPLIRLVKSDRTHMAPIIPLTDEEYEYIKLHPVSGYHILKEISASSDIAIGAKYHHERYDGKGYPNGLEGENIPEIARILGVADAYDAMSSNRCYRKALPQDVVRAEIVKGRGTQFDLYIAGIMLDIIDEDKGYRLKQNDEYHRTIAVVSENYLYNTVNSLLNHSDCVIEHYTEISEALYKCERGDIGLLLLDNDMDGISLKAISENLSHLETSLIVMCDNHNLQEVIDKEKIIIDDYIVKPLNSLQLNEMVHSVLN